MIRSLIALLVFVAGTCVSLWAEELPVPQVAAPPKPGLFNPELPLPELAVPNNNAPAANPAAVVAPDSLLPTPAPNPVAAPNIVSPTNPNPSGTTPSLPTDVSPAPEKKLEKAANSNVPDDLKWRYKWHNGQWWYWSPATDNKPEHWVIWVNNAWTPYDPATYQVPAGFAQPGSRVVNQRSNNPGPLPENYSTTEISVPQRYYLTPAPTYIAPTPYAYGTNSYYGPYGPAASYYNRRSGVSISIGTPAYVPMYGYPSYGYPGYYGGGGVSIGFGF